MTRKKKFFCQELFLVLPVYMMCHTVGPPYLRVPHLQIQPTKGWKYFFLIPESSKKQNLNLPQAGNDLHGF